MKRDEKYKTYIKHMTDTDIGDRDTKDMRENGLYLFVVLCVWVCVLCGGYFAFKLLEDISLSILVVALLLKYLLTFFYAIFLLQEK